MNKVITISAMEHIQTHWGKDAPEWVKYLAKECDKTSQSAVAKKLSRSASLLNQVLKNKYPGDLKGVEDRFNAAFKKTSHLCPILGNISGQNCLKNQIKKYDPSNHLAVRLFTACARCVHKLERKSDVK